MDTIIHLDAVNPTMAQHSAMDSHLAFGYTGKWIERLGRIGYVTKGVLYGAIGVLAFQAAFSAAGGTEGTRGAILEIADKPFGQVLLALITLGLFGYALWRLVQSVIGPGDGSSGAKNVIKRIAYFIVGLIYAGLSLWTLSMVLGNGSGGGGDGSSQREWTARLMSQPFGQWLVAGVGAVIVAVALYHFYQAYSARFMRHYNQEMTPTQRTWAERVGRFGLAARGVTFCIIGGFVIHAAIQADPDETRGLSGALQTLSEQAYGPWLLGVVALGFIAYGVYCVSRGRFGRFAAG